MRIPTRLEGLARAIEETHASPWHVVSVPLFVGVLRAFLEGVVFRISSFEEILNTVLFYTLLVLGFSVMLSFVLGTKPQRQLPAAALGSLLGIVPPFIDYGLRWIGISQSGRTYLFARQFHGLFVADYELVGESVVVWLAIALAALYSGLRRHSVLRGLLAAGGAWLVLQGLAFGWPMAARLLLDARPGEQLLKQMNWLGLVALLPFYFVVFQRDLRALGSSLIRASLAASLVILAARLVGAPWDDATFRAGRFAAVALLALAIDDRWRRRPAGHADEFLRDSAVVAGLFFQALFVFHEHRIDALGSLPLAALLVAQLVHLLPTSTVTGIARDSLVRAAGAASLAVLFGLKTPHGFGGGGDEILAALIAALVVANACIVAACVRPPAADGTNRVRSRFVNRVLRSPALRFGFVVSLALEQLVLLILVWVSSGFGAPLVFAGGISGTVVGLGSGRPRKPFAVMVLLGLAFFFLALSLVVEPIPGSSSMAMVKG